MDKTPLFTDDLYFYYALSGLLASFVIVLVSIVVTHLFKTITSAANATRQLTLEVALLKKGQEDCEKNQDTTNERVTRLERLIPAKR